jgi:peptidyl-prolyl cis-trans isomerase B (cyclophilin B)
VTNHKQWSTPPEMSIDVTKKYIATMSTSKGEVVLELDPSAAPKTVNNFVFLANQGYYDNITFHRVIANFMTQGGDPTGTGMGGPGYKFEDECKNNPLIHDAGVISMANAGPNTNGSQFFLVHNRPGTAHLDGKHTVFGKSTSGTDVILALRQGDQLMKVTISEAAGN